MRKSPEFIVTELHVWAAWVVPRGSRWLHKKGGTYVVLGHSFNTERNEVDVVYGRVAGPNYNPDLDQKIVYNRPLTHWTADRFTRL